MPSPVWKSVGTRSASASAATLTPAKPAMDGTGGVMLAICTSANNATHSTATSGWALIGQVNSGASFTASLWIADQSAAAPVFTWTGAAACSARTSLYQSEDGPINEVIAASFNGNGTANPHATASISTTKDNALAVYIDVSAANTALAAPAGWTEDSDAGSATDAGRTVFGSKAIPTSGSSSGAISVTGAAAAWVQWQVQLVATEAAGMEASKMETSAWVDSGDLLAITKMETSAWVDYGAGLEIGKIEVSAWIDFTGSPSSGRRRSAMLGSF